MANLAIPVLIKHCCVAIYREGKIAAKSDKDRFKQSLKIAKSRMAQYGFVVLGGEGLTDPIGLTPKGRSAEMRHKKEGRAKTVLFDTLYAKFDLDGSKAALAKKAQEAAATQAATAQDAKAKQSKADKAQAKENAAVDRQVRRRRS